MAKAKPASLTSRVTTLEDFCTKILERFDVLNETIVGNGKTGLVTDVAYIKGKVDGHVSTPAPSRKKIFIMRLAEVMGVTMVIGAVFLVIVLVFTDRMNVDDLLELVRAWKGGSS